MKLLKGMNMNSIDEVLYYLEIDNPIGALLLTGEWGCGKTYFIENKLKKKTEDKYEILRISLFGITDIQSLDKAVKRKWISLLSKGMSEKTKPIWSNAHHVKKILSGVPSIKSYIELADGIVSFDFWDFIKIKNKHNEKKVVLVFDDLERTELNTIEVLGVINEYCENLSFNVIIIANENHLHKSKEAKISYSEIKEKIIQTTVLFTPDYKEIVGEIVDEYKNDKEYYDFLVSQKIHLTNIFSGRNLDGIDYDELILKNIKIDRNKEEICHIFEEYNNKQHNIRSLKCSVQDFRRYFCVLSKKHIKNIDKYFMSFVSCMLAYKAGLYKQNKSYGYIFTNNVMNTLYPGYYKNEYMPNCIYDWITIGDWDQINIENYFEQLIYDEKNKSDPVTKVKNEMFYHLEEETIELGLEGVLKLAYSGKLSLDEYVRLISNSSIAREYKYKLPIEIDWKKVCDGINIRMHYLVENEAKRTKHNIVISNLDEYSEDEIRTYQLIDDFRNKKLIYEVNKKQYINFMRRDPDEAFRSCHDKRFNEFDRNMAEETLAAFDKADNYGKSCLSEEFKGFWSVNIRSDDFERNSETNKYEGFELLIKKLDNLALKYEGRAFACKNIQNFKDIVTTIMQTCNTIENSRNNQLEIKRDYE